MNNVRFEGTGGHREPALQLSIPLRTHCVRNLNPSASLMLSAIVSCPGATSTAYTARSFELKVQYLAISIVSALESPTYITPLVEATLNFTFNSIETQYAGECLRILLRPL